MAEAIKKEHPSYCVELRELTTKGDRILDAPLAKIGGKGLFTKELEQAMLDGAVDLAVHSLKDMPTEVPDGLVIGAITTRLDPGDAFVSAHYAAVEDLPVGARVGTSSLRRRAQLLALRTDIKICDMSGNFNTRLSTLERLGFERRIRSILHRSVMLPAVGQGALAIECRAGDAAILSAIEFLRDAGMTTAAQAERAFLRRVEGGCQIPVGVYAEVDADGQISIDAMIASVDGQRICRSDAHGAGEQAEALGTALAEELLDAGGREILKEIGITA